MVRAMAQKKPAQPAVITNRRARYDYQLGDELVVGLELTGPEVRAARDGHVQLKGAYVAINKDELWLTSASFSLKLNQKGTPGARSIDIQPRKLLAKRKEIDQLAAQKKQGMSIIPLKLLTQGRYIKLIITLGKGKKLYDKRHAIKKRDEARDTKRNLR